MWLDEDPRNCELALGLLLVPGPSGRDQHRTRDQEAEPQGFLVGTPGEAF